MFETKCICMFMIFLHDISQMPRSNGSVVIPMQLNSAYEDRNVYLHFNNSHKASGMFSTTTVLPLIWVTLAALGVWNASGWESELLT
jgi:hypothetical protein